eukprot:7416487-Pyramimonas_sp.AAC.1
MAPPILIFPSHPASCIACVLRAAVRSSRVGAGLWSWGRAAALSHGVTCLAPRAVRGPIVRIACPAMPSWRSVGCRGHAERRISNCPIGALLRPVAPIRVPTMA